MHLIFDFDGTITERDTISAFASCAIEHQHTQRGQPDLSTRWDQVVKDYMDDYQRHKTEYPVQEDDRVAVQQEVDFQNSLRDIEIASLDRIARSGVFAGLDATTLRELGMKAVADGKVIVRPGFKQLIDRARHKGWPVGVISVNWSRAFISGALHPHDADIDIIANEVDAQGKVNGPEVLGEPLTNSEGKLRVLDRVFGDDSVYFGDSTTDLECLLRRGIVLSNNDDSSLIRTLRRLGMDVSHVSEASTDGDAKDAYRWAKDFQEILDSEFLEV